MERNNLFLVTRVITLVASSWLIGCAQDKPPDDAYAVHRSDLSGKPWFGAAPFCGDPWNQSANGAEWDCSAHRWGDDGTYLYVGAALSQWVNTYYHMWNWPLVGPGDVSAEEADGTVHSAPIEPTDFGCDSETGYTWAFVPTSRFTNPGSSLFLVKAEAGIVFRDMRSVHVLVRP